MRILFLSPRQCWPARSGAKLREYHLMRALARRGELTYLYFADPAAPPLTRMELPFCHAVVGVPKPTSYGPTSLVRGLLGPWPLPILNYTSEAMRAAVKRQTDTTPFDILHLDSIHMIRYAEDASSRVVFNWHNIESEAMRRYAATETSYLRRWYAGPTAAKLKRLEGEILKTAFGHLVCSAREYDQLRQEAPLARLAIIPNGVDMPYFAGAGAGTCSSRNLVFVGSMDYYPNAEAMTYFCRQVWVRIRERMPDAQLSIVGANPGPAVQTLAELPGVTVTGTVPDIRPYYRDAFAAIVPLNTGGGTRLKILEAMAAGVPVISTAFGAEGLDVTPGHDILIARNNDPEEWVHHLLSLASPHAHLRETLTAAALDLVGSRYDWETLGANLCTTYLDWIRSDG